MLPRYYDHEVNGKGRILTPVTSKSLIFFKFELHIHDYVPDCNVM